MQNKNTARMVEGLTSMIGGLLYGGIEVVGGAMGMAGDVIRKAPVYGAKVAIAAGNAYQDIKEATSLETLLAEEEAKDPNSEIVVRLRQAIKRRDLRREYREKMRNL
jgi:hypothetical protein